MTTRRSAPRRAASDIGGLGDGRTWLDGAERDPTRLVAFTDAVIAIPVTLLVLEIHPPHDTRHLWHGLATLWPSYLAYAVTFLLIGQVWANHHVMFDHIRTADRMVLFLNTLLLMDIAFELAAILFNIIWWHARRDRRLLTTTVDSAGVKSISRRFQLALAWIAIGTLVGAFVPALGPSFAPEVTWLWFLASGVGWDQRRVGPGAGPGGMIRPRNSGQTVSGPN